MLALQSWQPTTNRSCHSGYKAIRWNIATCLSVTTKTTPSFSLKHTYIVCQKKNSQTFLSRFIEILATSFRNGAKMKLVFVARTQQTPELIACANRPMPEAIILPLKSSYNSAAFSRKRATFFPVKTCAHSSQCFMFCCLVKGIGFSHRNI